MGTITSPRGAFIAGASVVLALTLGPSPSAHLAIPRDTSDMALFEWALDRFDGAGLVLPALEVEFHDHLAPCHGYYGSFTNSDPYHIDICGFNNDRFLPAPKKMILHELAHAWLDGNADDDTRATFLELRRVETWNNPEADWSERGFEQAAEVIAWALLDEERRILTIRDTHPETLTEAYLLLTGRRPPNR
jgi:hypothetical protein